MLDGVPVALGVCEAVIEDVNVIEAEDDAVVVLVAVSVRLDVRLILRVEVAVTEGVFVIVPLRVIDDDDDGVFVGEVVTVAVRVGAKIELERLPQKLHTDNHFAWPQHGSPRVP